MTDSVNNTAVVSVSPPRIFLSSLQGLRTVAFAAIFLSHTGLGNFEALGAWGVSVFFILSGFVMLYSYYDRPCPKPGIAFAYRKIKKLYPLHIATMAAAAVYCYFVYGQGILKILTDIVLHAALIQIWIPNAAYYSTLNGLAWYLAACAFLYFAFPFILKRMQRASRKEVTAALAILFILQISVSAIAFFFGGEEKSSWFSMQWITYYCPLTRLIDFALGCCLGWLFLHTERQALSAPAAGIAQAVTVVAAAVSCVAYAKGVPFFGGEFIKYALLFTPTTIPLIWLTARGTGWLSRLLNLKPLVRFAKLTPYTFLIHGVVIKYCRTVISKLAGPVNGYAAGKYIVALAALILTVAAALIWNALFERVRRFLNQRQDSARRSQ